MRSGVIVAVVLLGAGCSSSGSLVAVHIPPVRTSVHVIYQLTGTASAADITYSVGDGGTQQQQGVDVPMVNRTGQSGLRFTARPGDFLYFSAQNTGEFGSLTCSIVDQGRTVTEHTSTGQFSIVTCQGTA